MQANCILLLMLPSRHTKHLELKLLFSMPFSLPLSSIVITMIYWQISSLILFTNTVCVSLGFPTRQRSEGSNDIHQQKSFFNEQVLWYIIWHCMMIMPILWFSLKNPFAVTPIVNVITSPQMVYSILLSFWLQMQRHEKLSSRAIRKEQNNNCRTYQLKDAANATRHIACTKQGWLG